MQTLDDDYDRTSNSSVCGRFDRGYLCTIYHRSSSDMTSTPLSKTPAPHSVRCGTVARIRAGSGQYRYYGRFLCGKSRRPPRRRSHRADPPAPNRSALKRNTTPVGKPPRPKQLQRSRARDPPTALPFIYLQSSTLRLLAAGGGF